ncbi:phage tail family protein [Clostridium pasteurianum]|uniref:phage distal tail protein n=1 Tax=Clostridium pasteurianum TaxID=1501 RepID=UPI002260E308|nr:phage tail domain-containing protein [Clostridium pasteurianum]UZW13190.1 phage tail family protein [Clostridium pasteurianum]
MLMLANKVNISNLGAELLDLDIQNSILDTEKDWIKKSYSPIILDQQFNYKKITTKIYIKGTSREDVLNKASNLKKLLKKATLEFDDMAFLYDSTLDNDSIERFGTKNKLTMICIFSAGYAYKSEVTETLNHVSSKTINVSGNLPTPAVITVTVPIDTISITLTGLGEDTITIKNLKANVPVIINGEDNTVFQSGANKFGDTDMWEFPSLKTGSNSIGLSTANCVVEIKYKPRWI